MDFSSLGLDYLAGNDETLFAREIQVGIQIFPLVTAARILGRETLANVGYVTQSSALSVVIETPARRCGLFE